MGYIKNLIRKMFPWFSHIILIFIWKFPHKKRIFLYVDYGLRDNLGAIYDYLIANSYYKKYKIICAFCSKKDIPQTCPVNVKYTGRVTGFIYFLFSGYCFYSFGFYPVKPAARQKVINLWHGMPLKAIGYLENGRSHYALNCFTHILITGECYAPVMKKAFGCKDGQIIRNGQPKSDVLYKPLRNDLILLKKSYCKIILWLPTFRSSTIIPYDNETSSISMDCMQGEERALESFGKLNQFLSDCRVLMILKTHPIQNLKRSCPELPVYSNIVYSKQLDIENEYELMKAADALLTDYSSAAFDYMLLDRPIGYIVDDFEEYKYKRGFVWEAAANYMPGKKICTYEDINEFILECVEGRDTFRTTRRKVNESVNQYTIPNNSRSLLEQTGVTAP